MVRDETIARALQSKNGKVDIDPNELTAFSEVTGNTIELFNPTDGMVRVLFIIEPLPIPMQTEERKTVFHTVRWNCNESVAHNVTLEGAQYTREAELKAIQKAIAAAQVNNADDIIPEGYAVGEDD